LKPEDYSERQMEVESWPVKITSYKLENEYHCSIDNVSPGAWIVRTTGATKQEAEEKALVKAKERLGRTRRRPI
jgi:hypothetical protein